MVVIVPCHCHSHRLLPGTGTTNSPSLLQPLFFILMLHSHQPLHDLSLSHLLSLKLQPDASFSTGTRVAVAASGSPVRWGTQSCNRKTRQCSRGWESVPRLGEKKELDPRHGKGQSRKHRPDDVKGVTSILEIYPVSPPLHIQSQGFLTQIAISGGWLHLDQSHSAEHLVLPYFSHTKILLQGCDSLGYKTLEFFAILN